MNNVSFWQPAGAALIGSVTGGLLTLTVALIGAVRERTNSRVERTLFLAAEVSTAVRGMVEGLTDSVDNPEEKLNAAYLERFLNVTQNARRSMTEFRWLVNGTPLADAGEKLSKSMNDMAHMLPDTFPLPPEFNRDPVRRAAGEFEEIREDFGKAAADLSDKSSFGAWRYFRDGKKRAANST